MGNHQADEADGTAHRHHHAGDQRNDHKEPPAPALLYVRTSVCASAAVNTKCNWPVMG
jgi:hypothetical protein